MKWDRCAVILSDDFLGKHPEDVVRCHGEPEIALCLPSGLIVALVCKQHEAVARA